MHALLGLETIEGHPKLGASWEGFALETVLAWRDTSATSCFWGTHGGAEIDLVWMDSPHRIGMEFKYTSAPRVTKSMRVAMDDLCLEHLYVIYAGEGCFPLAERITAAGLSDMCRVLVAQ